VGGLLVEGGGGVRFLFFCLWGWGFGGGGWGVVGGRRGVCLGCWGKWGGILVGFGGKMGLEWGCVFCLWVLGEIGGGGCLGVGSCAGGEGGGGRGGLFGGGVGGRSCEYGGLNLSYTKEGREREGERGRLLSRREVGETSYHAPSCGRGTHATLDRTPESSMRRIRPCFPVGGLQGPSDHTLLSRDCQNWNYYLSTGFGWEFPISTRSKAEVGGIPLAERRLLKEAPSQDAGGGEVSRIRRL